MSDGTSYMRVRILPKHDAMCLQIGDQFVMPGREHLPGGTDLRTVTNVSRKRTGSKSVTLDNGFVFDPSRDDDSLRNITIERPLAKFRASAFPVAGVKKVDE